MARGRAAKRKNTRKGEPALPEVRLPKAPAFRRSCCMGCMAPVWLSVGCNLPPLLERVIYGVNPHGYVESYLWSLLFGGLISAGILFLFYAAGELENLLLGYGFNPAKLFRILLMPLYALLFLMIYAASPAVFLLGLWLWIRGG